MPADEARKLVEELTCKFEEVMALNRQRARLVDILISERASDLTETEKELERAKDELIRSEAALHDVSQQITSMLRLMLSMRRGHVSGVNACELAGLFNAGCAGPVVLFQPYDDLGHELKGER